MVDKVKISRALADAIERNLRRGSKEQLLKSQASAVTWEMEVNKPLNDLSLWELAEILIKGYEVEKSPEEIIREKYKKERHRVVSDPANKWEADAYANGIIFTLEALGIEIEGVNKVGDSDVPKSN